MEKTYSQLLNHEIKNFFIFLVAMLVTSGIAFLKGFYKLDRNEKININLKYTLIVFLIYLFINLIVGPMVIKTFVNLISKNNLVQYSVLINFFLNLLILFLLWIFCFNTNPLITNKIIKKKTNTSKSIFYDILLGISCWIIAFPLVSLITSILDIFILISFKVYKLPDQIVIDFIKSTISHPLYFSLAIFMIVILAPILEEFLFRGVLQNFLKVYFKRTLAIIITSIIFAFFHYSPSQKLSNITILGSLFVFACFLSFLYEKQKSLISPIFLHATFNAISIINLIFIKGI